MNNSTILDEILDCKRSPNDKYGLGYNEEETQYEASTSKKHDVSLSLSKDEINVASQEPSEGKKNFIRIEQGRHQEATFTPKNKFRKETPSWWTQNQRC